MRWKGGGGHEGEWEGRCRRVGSEPELWEFVVGNKEGGLETKGEFLRPRFHRLISRQLPVSTDNIRTGKIINNFVNSGISMK